MLTTSEESKVCKKSSQGDNAADRALVRTNHCMPGRGRFYFEVEINNSYGKRYMLPYILGDT